MNKLRTRLKAISMPFKTVALALTLQCGINIDSRAQGAPDPSWHPTMPSISDMTLGGTVNGGFDWVNTDLYNLYPPGGAAVSPGYLHATAYDTWDGVTWHVIVVVYNSITNSFIVHKIADAKHPDIVLADEATASTPINVWVNVVYENLASTAAVNQITLQQLEIVDPFGSFTLTTPVATPLQVGNTSSSYTNKNPHIDMAPNLSGSTFLSGNLDEFAITWAEYDGGNWEIKLRKGDMTPPLGTTYTVDDGEMSDIACVRTTSGYISHLVYYDPGGDLKHAEFDVSSGTLTSTQVLETPANIVTPPRIEAYNREVVPSDVAWHAVAEVQVPISGGGTKMEIHEHRSQFFVPTMTNYSTIQVYDPISTTRTLGNNPLDKANGLAPCVAAGNGPRTLQRSGDVGNESYTMGWWIPGSGGYHALSTRHNSMNAADDGYDMINRQPVNGSGVIKPRKCWLALANGSNDGDRLAASWFSDFHWWGGSGAGYTIEGKVSNNFSFKPTSLTINSTRGGWLVYPNPATDYVGITGNGKASYSLTDLTGRALAAGEFNDMGQVSISHLPKGMYLLQIASEGKTESIKIVKD